MDRLQSKDYTKKTARLLTRSHSDERKRSVLDSPAHKTSHGSTGVLRDYIGVDAIRYCAEYDPAAYRYRGKTFKGAILSGHKLNVLIVHIVWARPKD